MFRTGPGPRVPAPALPSAQPGLVAGESRSAFLGRSSRSLSVASNLDACAWTSCCLLSLGMLGSPGNGMRQVTLRTPFKLGS